MKIFPFAAAAAAALILPGAAYAADAGQHQPSGHYEWREVPQFGPRAGGPVRKRVWVPDAQVAGCGCAMTKTDAQACMQSAVAPAAG